MPLPVSSTSQISSPTAPVSIPGVAATTVPDAIAEVNAKAEASRLELADLNAIDLVVWFENRLA